jgi:hypothetical protein
MLFCDAFDLGLVNCASPILLSEASVWCFHYENKIVLWVYLHYEHLVMSLRLSEFSHIATTMLDVQARKATYKMVQAIVPVKTQ